MKRYGLFLLVGALGVALGCSKDSPTRPQNNDTYKLEKTATIGPVGGAIAVDDFSLTIPGGAFEGDQTVKVYASSDDRLFGQNQVTRSFRLEGIPATFSQPLQVAIKYNGSLSEESYIARGTRAFDPVVNDTLTAYRLHAAVDSSNYLRCDLPAAHGDALKRRVALSRTVDGINDASGALDLLGITGHKTHKTPHFEIKYPVHLVEVSIAAVADILEDDYSAVVDQIHFSYEEARWTWPLQVVIMELKGNRSAYGAADVFLDGEPRLLLNQSKLSQGDLTLVRIHAGQELLFFAVVAYDPESYMQEKNLWLHLAITEWAEEKFTDNQVFRSPTRFPGNEMAPLNGLRFGASRATSVLKHGLGMSALIEYLTGDSRFGEYGLRDAYETIWSGSSATAALLNNVDALVAEWWPQFFKSYMRGGIYGVGKDVFTDSRNLSGSWTIATQDDIQQVFTGRYPDLSAKLYMINIACPTIDESADMTLKFSGHIGTHEPLGLMAFGVGSASLEYWDHSIAQGSTSLQVSGLRSLYDAGWRQILVAAICSNVSETYLQEIDADLEIRIAKEEEPVAREWNTGQLNLFSIRGHYARDFFDPGEEDTEYDYEDRNFESINFQGSTTGNTFTATWDHEGVTGAIYQGSVLAVFVGDPPSEISEIEWTESITTEAVTRSYSIILNDLTVSNSWDDGFSVEVRGGQTCDHIGSLSHTIRYSTFQDVLQEWKCNSEYPTSSIKVGFWKE